MIDIKEKKSKKGTIKTLNKAITGTERIKDNILGTKTKIDKTTDQTEYTSGANYAIDKISNVAKKSPNESIRLYKHGKNNFIRTTNNVKEIKEKIKYIKKRNHAKKVAKNIMEDSKQTKNIIKTAENVGKNTIKTTQTTERNIKAVTQASMKVSKKAIQMANETMKKTYKNIKLAIKMVIKSVKAVIAGTKALILLITGGAWVVIMIVIVICLIAMLCASIFGIFFSSEYSESTITVDGIEQNVTMSSLISDLNIEFMNKITQIQQENPYDEYDITGSRADWTDILAVYVAKVSGGDNEVEMLTLDDNKVAILKEVFWTMNEVTFTKEEETYEEIVTNLTSTETVTVTYTKLHIIINSKTAEEIAEEYGFSQEQKNQIAELQKEDYASMWSSVIYGSSTGSNDIVEVALNQIGNIGGETYWSWYGFNERVEWCACFVSWCANQCRIYRYWYNTKICKL